VSVWYHTLPVARYDNTTATCNNIATDE